MQTDISKFKEQISMLMEYIRELSGGDSILEKVIIKIRLGLSANPRETVEIFTAEITDFADEILSGNDHFFLEESNFEENALQPIFNKLKQIWKNTATRDQKDKIIRFFKILVILGCIITKNEKLRQVINTFRDADNPLMFT
jgi:hypothetical protein